MDFPGSGAGDDADGLAVDEGELVALSGHGFAGVDHADVDFLGGDHDAAPGGDTPLDGERPGRAARKQAGAAGVDDARRFRARQGLPERIEDPAAVAVFAAIMRDSPARPTPSERSSHERKPAA